MATYDARKLAELRKRGIMPTPGCTCEATPASVLACPRHAEDVHRGRAWIAGYRAGRRAARREGR